MVMAVVLLGCNTVFARTLAQIRSESQAELAASGYEPGSRQAAYTAAIAHQHMAAALREQARETGNWNAYDRFMWPGLITTSTPVEVSEETIKWKQSLVDNKNAPGTSNTQTKTFEKSEAAITNPYVYKMQYIKDQPQQHVTKDVAFVGQMGGNKEYDLRSYK